MIPIDSRTVAAESFGDLRDAVSANNDYEYVYLANDIVITAGVTILASKASLTIDGEYPVGSGTRHALTDINSELPDATLGLRNTSTMTITMKNLVLHGRNFYGLPYIAESALAIRDTSGVSLLYENVVYDGPQITYHHNGLTRYTNCDITITQTGISGPEEVGEVNRVELGGTVRITHNSTTDAVFWFRDTASTSSLTVLAGAQVEITSANYFMFNLDGTFISTLVPTTFAIQSGGSLSLRVNKGISYSQSHTLNAFTLADGAAFRYVQDANNGASAALYLNGALTVGSTARFYMQAQNGTQPLLSFTNGTGRSLNVASPLSFVLYSPNAPALASAGTTQVSLSGGQLNYWRNAVTPVGSAGGFGDPPLYKWNKLNYATTLVVTGNFTASATTVTSNLTAEDGTLPAISNLHLHEARVLSIGDWPVIINPIIDDGRDITGYTEPGANLRAEYTISGSTHILPGAAGSDGRYAISTAAQTPDNIPAGTEVALWSNIPFLIKRTLATAIAEGEFELQAAPEHIAYGFPSITAGSDVFLRRYFPNNDEPVVVYDGRVDSTAWQLLASITGDLVTADGTLSLPESLVYRDEGGNVSILSAEPMVIYTGEPNGGAPKTTSILWNADRGILLLPKVPIRIGVEYASYVKWELHPLGGP